LEAESHLTQLLDNDLFNKQSTINNETDTDDKTLIQLKYIILKNLASITSEREDYASSLNHLIEAAKIDATDLLLWYDIGMSALKMKRFLIARWSFEESLRINSSHWPSIDNIIILLYSQSNYSACLKYIFDALKLDKFYINGIVLLKKLELQREVNFLSQIELFIQINYTSNGISIDNVLSECSPTLYDDLFNKIDYLKDIYMERRQFLMNDDELNLKPLQMIINKGSITTWKSLGQLLIQFYESNRHHLLATVQIIIQTDDSNQTPTTKQTNEIETIDVEVKQNEINKENSNFNKNKTNRQNIENNDSSWWTSRRSSKRKGNTNEENTEEDDFSILNILETYFDYDSLKASSHNKNNSVLSTPLKSKLITTNINKLLIKEDEPQIINAIIDQLSSESLEMMNILDIIKVYLSYLSLNYDKEWPLGLEKIYSNLFDLFNSHYDIYDAISTTTANINNNEECSDELLTFYSIIIVHLEIEFSKLKEIHQKENLFDQEDQNNSDNDSDSSINSDKQVEIDNKKW
jgi:hypothetical protein